MAISCLFKGTYILERWALNQVIKVVPETKHVETGSYVDPNPVPAAPPF